MTSEHPENVVKRLFPAVAVFAVLLLALGFARPAHAQTKPQAIQGHVTSDSGKVIASADVIVTVAPSAETIMGKSDASGNYRVAIANATGEYILNISALGFKPFRQRVTIAGGDSVATVDAKLVTNVQTVAAVKVQAQRSRPSRSVGIDNGNGTDPNNKTVDGVTNALSPDLQGSIDAMAGLIPGLNTINGGGFSAFGLGGDANMKTLNGMTFAGDALPRDLATSTRYVSSPWDPTSGGFSGALAATTIARGSNLADERARVTLDAPFLQVGDPIAERFGQKFTNFQVGGSRAGALLLDKYFYNAGYQASVNRAPVSSLLDLDADALAHAGISPDSALRLTQLLAAAHVPLTRGGIPDARTTYSGSYFERFDYALPSNGPGNAPPPAFNGVVGLTYSETRGSSLSPTIAPATTGKSTNGSALVQGTYSRFFGHFGDYVNETSAGLSFNQSSGTPYLELPSGSVLIASSLADATPTIGSLGFGGNSAFARDTKIAAAELNNQTTFLINGHASLPTKIYLQGRYEHFGQSLSANRLGSFSYASLSDLAANRPSSFTRTLNTPDRNGGEFIGAAAIGTTYNHPKFVLTGGARLDANAFTGTPDFNPAIASAFGIRNDRAPNSIDVSPRLGFNWYYTARRSGLSMLVNQFSTQLRGGPQIRGGFGKFRNFLRSDLLADAIGSTGLPGSAERLTCIGSAAPIPNWQQYMDDPASVPTTCAGGSSVFADTVPNAILVDPAYKPMTSWRGTLGWTNTILGNYFAIDGTYSLNLNQASTSDLNFAGVQRFALSAEGNRPVYVPASSIVPSTGSVATVDSRLSPQFGRVSDRLSDLRGDTKQVAVYMIPDVPFQLGIITLGYTWADVRSQARGFDASTANDPRSIEWATSGVTPRHAFVIQGGRGFWNGRISATVSAKVMSGLRYTPVVSGDVNGDGWSNDRAFVFDPSAASTDTAVARGLRDILAGGSKSARDCLNAQLGAVAGRNSCVGPWSTTMNASVFASNLPRTNNRLTVTLNLANPLAGVDQLLHGSDHLRGWGMVPFADGTLYQVRGFDQTTQRFVYQVNPRFGNTNPATSTFRAPFRMTLDMRFVLGPDRNEQAVDLNMRIKPPMKGTRATADTIKNRYLLGGGSGANGYSDLYKSILRFADSLALSRDQVERLQARQKQMFVRADSVYASLAKDLVAMPADYDVKAAAARVVSADNDMWQIIYAERTFLKELLTPGQIRLLPGPIFQMIVTENYRSRFWMG